MKFRTPSFKGIFNIVFGVIIFWYAKSGLDNGKISARAFEFTQGDDPFIYWLLIIIAIVIALILFVSSLITSKKSE